MKNFNQLIGCLMIGAVCLVCSQPANAQSFDDLDLIAYEKQVNAILKTRLPAEKRFVNELMTEIAEKEIPRSLVDTSFKWVLNRRPNTNYPFVYFERVIRLQGKRLGYKIPPFNYKVYSLNRYNYDRYRRER
ncbi:MAG: hypothetical protein MK108_13025 [Mariniblastus sp.]|nr:hypothetical protein [Mariniblastus sp.]